MSSLPHIHPSVVHMLAAAAAAAPGREALVCGDERLDYAGYLRCVAGFAHELVAMGATLGRVGILLPNSIDACVAMFGAHAARAQATPFNPLYTEHELRSLWSDAELQVIVFAEERRPMVEALADELGIAHRVCIGSGAGSRRLDVWRDQSGLELPQPLPAADDLATLQYTGGTTGRSKGVELTHRAVAVNISQREALLPARKDVERLLCVMPLFHVYAVAMCLHNMAYARGTLIILTRYTPEAVFDAIGRERVSIFAGSPTLFIGLLGHAGFTAADFSSLTLSYSGSAALPEALLRRWEAATGVPVMEGYGQTESGPVISFNPLDGVRKSGSVGIALPATEVQIVDLERGTEVLPPGEKGEIRIRGPQVMAGYRKLPDETAQTLRDGWLHTGDIGEFDADGYLYIRDRKKEMAKVSGFNVFPREIEEVLHGHPAVAEAAAVAVADDYRGEIIVAFAVARPGQTVGAEDLIEHCRTRLARYKVPSRIEVVAQLPRTGVGKLDKMQLREHCKSLPARTNGNDNA